MCLPSLAPIATTYVAEVTNPNFEGQNDHGQTRTDVNVPHILLCCTPAFLRVTAH